jgi:hypothetical protein
MAVSGCDWSVKDPDPTIHPTEAKCVRPSGLEVYAFGDGRWRIFTQINGVHVMASGETRSYRLFQNSERRLVDAQDASSRAAEILEVAGAKGGF